MEAKENAIVTVDAGLWMSMMRMVFQTLSDRPVVALEVLYWNYGQRELICIPAGTNVMREIGQNQIVQFSIMPQLFSVTPQAII